jgi:hypothetical protein
MKNRILLYYLVFVLPACSSSNNPEIEGDWILNGMVYKGKEIHPQSHTAKLVMNPVSFANKEILTFQSQSKTGRFPGLQSPDFLIKWKVKGDSIFIEGDSLFLKETILKPIEHLKTDALLNQDASMQQMYEHKKDSILTNIGFSTYSKALEVYTGKYKMEKYDDKTVLISKTTVMELVNLEKAYDAAIDKAFPGK